MLVGFGVGGRKGERGRKTSIGCLLYAPRLGTEPKTQACALTRNQTCDPLACGTVPSQLNHMGKGGNPSLKELFN